MALKLRWSVVLLTLALPAWAASRTATISGLVRNGAGVAQMGALVEVIPAGEAPVRRAFSDDRGQYLVTGLTPGSYSVKVSASSFLPSLRENVRLAAGAHALVNVTLNTLMEAIDLLPQRRNSPADQDDWDWTLRSAGNRPILRVLDDGQSVVVASSERARDRRLRAHVAFVAGSEAAGFGSNADATTSFSLEHSMFSTGTLAFQGNVGYGEGEPGGVVRATYSQQLGDSRPEISLTARRFAAVATAPQYGALQAFSVTTSDTMTLAEAVEVTAGSDFQVVEFARQVHALRPFARVRIHLDPDTVLEYRYASAQPNMRAAKGFDTAPADLSESAPRFSLAGEEPVLERARHHELSLSRRFGRTNVQAAAYVDQVTDAALLGVGTVGADSGDLLPDVYSNTFSWNGGDLRTTGARLVLQQRLAGDVTATLDYATGGVIAIGRAPGPLNWEQVQTSLRNERRHAVAAKLAGRLPRAHTRWLVSYRWTNGHALTPVDWFDASPGQADPYFSLFIRQPLPRVDLLPGRMELMVDVRNLLAQGYVPVLGSDGQTLYLVQAARSVRGGLAFSF